MHFAIGQFSLFQRFRTAGLLLVAALLAMSLPSTAQDVTGTLYGIVTDSTGAVVPNASVTINEPERGVNRHMVSNGSGEYNFPQLPIGHYTVTVAAQGFQTFVQKQVPVDPSQESHVDVKLRTGDVSSTVTVESTDAVIDTRSATIGTLIDRASTQELPIDGNNIVNLTGLLPGVTEVNAPATFTNDRQGPTYSASGSRVAQNLFLLDGIIYNNLFRNTGNTYPPRQAISEIQVLMNNYNAEYGRNAGSIFSAVTKSGTNVFRGSLWESAENTAFNAKNYLSGKLSSSNKLIQNQFGATLGGPVLRDKLFFFVTYEGHRLRQASSSTVKVLTSAEFRDANTDAVFPNPVLDPTTGKPFPNNTVPHSRFDPTAVKFLTTFGLTSPSGSILTVVPAPQNFDLGLGRVDWNLSHRQSIDMRYYQIDANQVSGSGNIYTYDTQFVEAPSRLASVSDTFVINNAMVNVARLAYRRSEAITTPDDTRTLASFGANWPNFGQPTLPTIALTSLFTLSSSSNTPAHTVNENVEFNEDLSWTRGTHNLKFGGNYLRLQYANVTNSQTQGNFSFSGAVTQYTDPKTKKTYTTSAADFLLGLPASLTVASPTLVQAGIQHEFFFYAQDEWRARPNLTISYGLRYELPFNWYQPKNYWGTFAQGRQSVVIPTAPKGLLFPGDPGVSRGIVPTDWHNLGPRFGFSYDPTNKGKFVVRGGAGLFFDAINADIIQNQTQPFQYSYTFSNVYSFTDPLRGQPTIPRTVNLQNPQFVGLPSIKFPDPHLTSPRVGQFNLGIQQQLPKQIWYEVDYVGRFSRKLFVPYTYNPAVYGPGAVNSGPNANTDQRRIIQGFGDIEDLATIGTANYNGLQVRATRRVSSNVTINGSYTWAHSFDTGSSYDSEAGYLPHSFDIAQDYGPSDFNADQVVTAGYVWNLPVLKGRNFLLREAVGGWMWSGIYNWRSGLPLNITTGTDQAYSTEPNQRPVYVHNPNLPQNRPITQKIPEFFDPTAFAMPDVGTYGNVSRNSVTGPHQETNSMSLGKGFHIPGRENAMLQYRCDAFGVFNSPQLKAPSGSSLQLGSSLGKVTNTTGERKLQMQLLLTF